MTQEVEAPATPKRRRRLRWWSALAKTTLSLIAGAMLMLLAAGLLIDTDLGHRIIIDRVAAMTPQSGLRIRIGRIEGSIWGRTELRDVRLSDPDGLFAEAPQMLVDWEPLAWLYDRLAIKEVTSNLVIVHRPARFEPPRADDPVLPESDFSIGKLDIAQLRLEPAVAGVRRVARVTGQAEYRSGRFLLDLDAEMRGGGDRLALLIDAAPERDQFDLDLALDAPADGVLVRMLGLSEPLRAQLRGAGSWQRWDGRARLAIDGREAGDLRVAARSGHYGTAGWIAPGPLLGPRFAALAASRFTLRADGRLAEGVLDGQFIARSPAARLAVQGGADLRGNAYRDLRAGLVLLQRTLLLDGVQGSAGTRLTIVADGPFADRAFAWRLMAPRLEVGNAAFETLQASGSGRRSGEAMMLPLVATARQLSANTGTLLADIRLGGTLRAQGDRISGEALTLTSDRLRSTFRLQADLASGRTALQGTAASEDYRLAGIGTIDVAGNWRAASGAGGFSLNGDLRGTIRRFDNAALEWAAGGPLRFETGIGTAADGAVRLPGLRLAAPRLQLAGSASRRSDGGFEIEGRGRQASLGPLTFRYDGARLSLLLPRPSQSLGLADVRLEAAPGGQGFAYRASGQSPLGPFAARGALLMRSGGTASLEVAALNLSGASASGVLRAEGGGIAGTLLFRGALSGPLEFGAGGGEQRVEARLVASDARLGRVPIGSGRIVAAVAMGSGGALDGRLRFEGAADRLWAMAGPGGTQLSGALTAEAVIGGSVAAPVLGGTLRLDRARFVSAATGVVVQGVEARGRFDGNRLILEAIEGRTGGEGRISGSGSAGFDGTLDLSFDMRSALLLNRPDLRARITGPIRIEARGASGSISGDLRLSDAAIRFGGSGSERGSAGGGSAGASSGGWRLALRVATDRAEVAGRGLDSRWRAALRVGGTTGAPSLTGEAILIDGSYRILGRPIALSRGTMTFAGEMPPDPRLDILAGSIRIGGRASRPEIGVAAPGRAQDE